MEKNKKQEPTYNFPFQLGPYRLTKLIGRGGMGEIFLAEDPTCKRTVALKRILPKHMSKEILRKRFLNEPRIAAQLPHPSIIPVYALHEESETIYYTMPYIEGQTLREILLKTRASIERGRPPYPVGSSIQTLMLLFLNICNAIEYTHSKGFLHRDIKPENIIVGKFNEVVILDWGVATAIENAEEDERGGKEDENASLKGLTMPGKTVGTVEFMAPERALGAISSVKTDIYSLGATLHFILTLYLPFNRPNSLKEWRRQLEKVGTEKLLDPQEVAPYREITPQLSRITMKCMHPDATMRYSSVQELIDDVHHYIEGKPEWTLSTELQISRSEDWEFQENILLAKHMAISRYAGMMEWYMLMLSKEVYSGNIQLKAVVTLKEGCRGIGFLMGVPEKSERQSLESGFLIWIGSKEHPGCKFLRSNIEVINKENIYLEAGKKYVITLERQDNTLSLSIDGELMMSYATQLPIVGGHFGLLFRDADFEISPISLFMGSQNVRVNCLSVPDAFLMIRDYPKALSEYRRIARSFKGRAEGREATFRAGVTLIEMGKSKRAKAKKSFAKALEEFEKLHKTAGAPLEYLGKALVYQSEKNLEEETKCLELVIRMYPRHPLTPLIKEHIIYRLHESGQHDRIGAYTFALLTLRHLPTIYERKEAQNFIKNLCISWEEIPFIETPANFQDRKTEQLNLSIQLAFCLTRPTSLYELALLSTPLLLKNALLSLLALGYPKLVDFILTVKFRERNDPEFLELKATLEKLMSKTPLTEKLDLLLQSTPIRFFISLIKESLTPKQAPALLPYFEQSKLPKSLHIWALLLAGREGEAKRLLESEEWGDSASPFYMLQGCYLASVKGERAALSHFDGLIEVNHPKTTTLLGRFLKGEISLQSTWMSEAFLWEKLELYRQLALYHHCLKEPRKAAHYRKMVEKEFSQSQIPLNFI